MKTIISMALKNLRRHRRRTVINIIGVAISAGLLFFFIGYYRGTYISMMRESFINFKTGHIQVHTKQFDDKKIQDFVSRHTMIGNYGEIVRRMEKFPEVKNISLRLTGPGFAGNGREKMMGVIVGVDPALEKKASPVHQYIVRGSYLDKTDGVLIGKKAADLFGLKVGDLCYIQSQTVHDAPNLVLLPVAGIFSTGFYELDKSTFYISLKSAGLLFDTESAVNTVMVFLNSMDDTDPVTEKIKRELEGELDVRNWKYYGQALLENEKGDGIFYTVFIIILIFISVSTITSTMYMNVYERIREIGTLRAMGWKKSEIFRLFVSEAVGIGIMGGLAGLVLGGIPTLYMMTVGIETAQFTEVVSFPMFKMISKPVPADILFTLLVSVLATYIGGLLPARKAGKMVITDALRTV